MVLESALSEFSEISGWVRGGLGHDLHKLHNLLILRLTAALHTHYWPVLVDPDDEGETILRLSVKRTNGETDA